MPAEYVQVGERLMYKNTGTEVLPAKSMVAFGDVVGVTLNDIQPGLEGPAELGKVWRYPAALSAAVERGTRVYFDPATDTITDTDASGAVPAGILATDAEAGAATVEVKINA